MIKQVDKIEIRNGTLCLWKGGVGRSCPCLFAFPESCGDWCPHFGDVQITNGDPRLDFILTLGCGGTVIVAKEYVSNGAPVVKSEKK